MILTLDNSAFTLVINPDAGAPIDPSTGKPLKYAKERVEGLIAGLGTSDRLIIPTPVLAEALVVAEDAGPELIDKIQSMAKIVIAPFDQRAAVELAMMHRETMEITGKKKGTSLEPWQKVRFDRQIAAIAKVNASDAIYCDDKKLCEFAKSVDLKVKSTWDLTVPEKVPDLFGDIKPD